MGGSQFWHGIHKIKHFFKLGAKFHLGLGDRILFWSDLWLGEAPLCDRFPRLFEISSDPNLSVAQAYQSGSWDLQFRRSFGPQEISLWDDLWNELEPVAPSPNLDSVS